MAKTSRNMTIIEAIIYILKQAETGLNVDEIYSQIIQQNLYEFGAKNPKGVVNGEIRRHCVDLNFPTAHPIKYFYMVGSKNKRPLFHVVEGNVKTAKALSDAPIIDAENLPEENVEKVVATYNQKIKEELMNKIMFNDPAFFERLVVDLLLKMGYGYDNESGAVVGKSHDGGIDGIINEDKLGLDLIYIQAKRYAQGHKVSRSDIQAFVGAMEGIQKGVFLTTSSFTREAEEYAQKLQYKNFKLVDGNLLLSYMLKYEVGVQTVKSYKLMKIDEDYFI